MSDAYRSWWLGTDRVWRRGTPPPGWRQEHDGRWQPPERPAEVATQELPVQDDAPGGDPPAWPSEPSAGGPARGGRHMAAPGAPAAPRPGHEHRRRGRARFWLLAGPGLFAALGLTAGALAATGHLSADDVGPAADPRAQAPPPTTPPVSDGAGGAAQPRGAPGDPVAPTTTTGGTSTTVTRSGAPPVATTEPAPSPSPSVVPPLDPFAACSPGQRQLIARGDHPWSWYVERFDPDGDGIFCT
jgi:hypothetical protein